MILTMKNAAPIHLSFPKIWRCFLCMGIALFALDAMGEADPLFRWSFPAYADPLIERDIGDAAHHAQLLRGDFRHPFPSRVRDGAYGAGAGALRLERDGRVHSLAPIALPERWTLAFWMRDARRARDIPDTFDLSRLLAIERRWLGLGDTWIFRQDPDNVGVEKEWFRGNEIDAWAPIQVPAFWRETQVAPLSDGPSSQSVLHPLGNGGCQQFSFWPLFSYLCGGSGGPALPVSPFFPWLFPG